MKSARRALGMGFLGNLSSESFVSDFSGYGWSILNNLTTGNTSATFDELTIQKKMRIYELEAQKTSATTDARSECRGCLQTMPSKKEEGEAKRLFLDKQLL